MEYFKNVRTVEELKRQYRHLVLMWHPDRGGTEEDMRKINREYDMLLRRVGNVHESRNGDGETWEDRNGPSDRYSCNIEDLDDGFRKVLDILLTIKGIDVLLVGEWLWISGDTKDNKETLKGIGCRWSGKRQMWYWHKPEKHYRRASKESFEGICRRYGVSAVAGEAPEERKRIA